jgi:hypothetical protein
VTSPRLAQDSPYGRLYCHPNHQGALTGDLAHDVDKGLLVPSVTNVIGILDKPHLYDWYGRKAADAALEVSRNHPGLITKKPNEARKWLSLAARRHMTDAADLGTRVHSICEQLALGATDVPIQKDERPYVDAWYAFTDEFQPRYLQVESTVFGDVHHEGEVLGYAGTADFFAEVDGLTVVGDLKTGRGIHTEAALQLNALSSATQLVGAEDEVLATPQAHAGLVVHLTKQGFAVHLVPLAPEPMAVFGRLRSLWRFHVANAAASGPLHMSGRLRNLKGFRTAFDSGD